MNEPNKKGNHETYCASNFYSLTPDRIIEDVQLALQQQGYYAGSFDGLLRPQIRGALAAFQSNYGFAITSAVDRPTLQTLGLT
jgi:peptidoglycan hydrolase-like protein with peptidoglycan-binding domain